MTAERHSETRSISLPAAVDILLGGPADDRITPDFCAALSAVTGDSSTQLQNGAPAAVAMNTGAAARKLAHLFPTLANAVKDATGDRNALVEKLGKDATIPQTLTFPVASQTLRLVA